MLAFAANLHPVLQALLATLFTWSVTALGAATVFLTRSFSRRLLDTMLGFASGVMIAASYFSLLAPAIEMAEGQPIPAWFPAAVGVALGAGFLRSIDLLLPHLHTGLHAREHVHDGPRQCRRAGHEAMGGRLPFRAGRGWRHRGEQPEGLPTSWRRTVLLVLAFALHNLPEGLTVGVAFGAAASGIPAASMAGALALTFGMAIQNFPEGIAVALPLRREGLSPMRSFWVGQLSAIVEPIAGVLGAVAVLACQPLMPYALAFAAGAMIFVVVEELVPECQNRGNSHFATMGAVAGFILMLILAVALE